MPLAFRGYGWARWLYELFGGYPTAGCIHRICSSYHFLSAFMNFLIFLFYNISVKKKKGSFGDRIRSYSAKDIFDIIIARY